MQYFQAVQQGKIRANKSQMKMFDVAGFWHADFDNQEN